jgi:hypothetical protein
MWIELMAISFGCVVDGSMNASFREEAELYID